MERNLINKMNEGWAAETTLGATLRQQRAVVTGKQRHGETRCRRSADQRPAYPLLDAV
jgi:hypothetical protein